MLMALQRGNAFSYENAMVTERSVVAVIYTLIIVHDLHRWALKQKI